MEDNAPLYEVRKFTDIRDMLNQSLSLYPDRPAFKLRNAEGKYEPRSYRDFIADVRALGTGLWKQGFHGGKIAVMGVNSYEWGLAYLATMSGLGVIVPIDKDLPFDDVNNILNVSGAELLITDKKGLAKLKPSRDRLPAGLKVMKMTLTAAAGMRNFLLSMSSVTLQSVLRTRTVIPARSICFRHLRMRRLARYWRTNMAAAFPLMAR